MYKNREVSNSEDVVDSRDIIKRIEELEEAHDDFILEHSSIPEEESPGWGDIADAQGTAEEEWDESEEGEELKVLKALADECEGYGDWNYGEALIRDSYFEDYARQLADELGYMDSVSVNHWPFTCIDWEKATDELKMDYMSVDWDGVTYWMRS